MVVPQPGAIDEEIAKATAQAVEKCVTAGADEKTIEVVEIDTVPVSYVTNGATRIFVRVVGALKDNHDSSHASKIISLGIPYQKRVTAKPKLIVNKIESPISHKGSSYDIVAQVDVETYRPRVKGDLWYLSELDLQFLQDGAGILSVGSCGEPYSAFLTLRTVLRNGQDITIRRQDTLPDDAVVFVAGFMVCRNRKNKLQAILTRSRALQVSILSAFQEWMSKYSKSVA